MTKAKEAKEESVILYDSATEQNIPLNISQNGRTFVVRHSLVPLDDERYFTYRETLESDADRLKKLSTDIYRAKDGLWVDLAQSVEGYKPRDDFKSGVPQSHRVESVNALLEVVFTEPDNDENPEYFDIDALITIPFSAMFSGALLTDLSLTFRPESKAEMDTFLGITNNQPDSGKMASAEKKSQHEKLCELGKKMLKDRSGYKDGSDVPAWHLAPAVEVFFLRQIAQAGKASA